jgi:hypothetical protein
VKEKSINNKNKKDMRKIILQITAILLILAGMVSCGKEKEEPIEIPFTEYSLNENCSWCDFENDTIAIINTENDLKRYINCYDYPEIDFTKNSLLLIGGISYHGGFYITNTICLTSNGYDITVLFHYDTNVPQVITYWHVALLIDKIYLNTQVNLIKI